MKRLHLYVEGKVQGVFFRDSTRKKADELGLVGWVANINGGRLEIVAEGEKEVLKKLIDWVKVGPPLAEVEHVDVVWEDATGEFSEFSIKKT